MVSIDKIAVMWSIVIVAIGVGISFYGYVGGDVTNPSKADVQTAIDNKIDVLDAKLEMKQDALERATIGVLESKIDAVEKTVNSKSEFIEELIEDPEKALTPSIRGEETGAQTGEPFEDIAEEVKSKHSG